MRCRWYPHLSEGVQGPEVLGIGGGDGGRRLGLARHHSVPGGGVPINKVGKHTGWSWGGAFSSPSTTAIVVGRAGCDLKITTGGYYCPAEFRSETNLLEHVTARKTKAATSAPAASDFSGRCLAGEVK